MKRLFAILMCLAVILASCEAPPGPEGYDWCFTYAFAESDYGINIQNGEWLDGEGIITDSSGLLQMSWVHDQTVLPSIVIVTVVRPTGVTGDVGVQAAGIIFDVAANIDQTLPDGIDEAVLSFEPETTVSGSETANITVDATDELIIQSIEIRGQGFTPFDTNECGPATFTPFPTETVITPTPSATNTPLVTDTPSPTNTPSPTPVDICSPGGYLTAYFGGHGTSGITWVDVGWNGGGSHTYDAINDRLYGDEGTYTNSAEAIHVEFSVPSGWTDIDVFGSMSGNRAGSTVYIKHTVGSSWIELPPFASSPEWREYIPHNVGVAGTVYLEMVSNTVNPGDGYSELYAICVYGANTPTPTSTPTNTLTPTHTVTASRTPLASHTPFSGTSTRTPVQIASQTPRATNTLAPSPTPPSFTPQATRTNMASPTRFTTTTAMPTSTGTVTATSEFDEIEEQLEDIEDVNTNILNGINDFFAWVQGTALNFFDWLAQGFNWILSAFNNLLIFVGNIFQSIWQFILSIIAFFQLIFDIIRLIIDIIVRLITLFAAWISQFSTIITSIISQFFSAPATPIPGFPTCASDPTAYDMCALYYMLDYTIFAQGTMGQFILPLVLLNIDFWLFYFFTRFVLRLLKIGREATSV